MGMVGAMTDLISCTERWIDGDPDPATRDELRDLITQGAVDELAERMNGSLAFGTAGLRGAVEAGSNRMNRAVVIRTTAGLARFLLDRCDGTPDGPVVVGFDGRLSSRQFSEDTIGVLLAAGLSVRYWPDPIATPLVAFAGASLGAMASVVVTASHNPPQDNGYKVFDSNGAQIVPPVDAEIAARIDAAPPANEVPIASWSDADPIDESMIEAYEAAVQELRTVAEPPAPITIAYTPLHGVGWRSVDALLSRSGYTELRAVPAQREPDGHFPTVAFPNPEEPGALDLVLALAGEDDADVVLANDPDADRLAMAAPIDGTWTALSGNQLGSLLADYVLRHHRSETRPIVINSIVSSPMLKSIAEAYGAHFATTLTGFKWIANAAMDLEAAGVGEFVFGFEEALGYTVGPVVRDKDGVSGALIAADMVAVAKARGQTVADLLDDVARRFGLWVSVQQSIVRPGSAGAAEIAEAMERLERRVPDELAGDRVTTVDDYRTGADDRPRWLPAAALVILGLESGGRVLVRPSGTEPKLKLYVDLTAPHDPGNPGLEDGLRTKAHAIAQSMADFLDLT